MLITHFKSAFQVVMRTIIYTAVLVAKKLSKIESTISFVVFVPEQFYAAFKVRAILLAKICNWLTAYFVHYWLKIFKEFTLRPFSLKFT